MLGILFAVYSAGPSWALWCLKQALCAREFWVQSFCKPASQPKLLKAAAFECHGFGSCPSFPLGLSLSISSSLSPLFPLSPSYSCFPPFSLPEFSSCPPPLSPFPFQCLFPHSHPVVPSVTMESCTAWWTTWLGGVKGCFSLHKRWARSLSAQPLGLFMAVWMCTDVCTTACAL